MNGWLVVNGYLNSNKFEEIYEWLICAAKERNCRLRKVTNDQLLSAVGIESGAVKWNNKPDFVLFWDKDYKLARLLENSGLRLFNNAAAIEICDDKALTFLSLKNEEIKMPKTFLAPMTFEKQYSDYAFLMQVEGQLGFPFIIKANKGSFGAQVYMVKNHSEAIETIKKIENNEFIMQQYIQSSKGRDVRIHVVGDKIVAAMKRVNKDDFRANITNGGKMEKIQPTAEQTKMALEVCKALNLDFAGVDIMFGENEEPVFCEVNSNAHFKNIFDCTGINVANSIMDYIIEKVLEENEG